MTAPAHLYEYAGPAAHDRLDELNVFTRSYDPPPDYSDARAWLKDTLSEYCWDLQSEIWQATEQHNAVAVLSCNNSGKTWLAARVVAKFIRQYHSHGCRVVTTAPTAAQVSLLLWQEIRTAFNKAKVLGNPFPGRIVASPFPQWKIGDTTVGWGRKPADQAQSAMQGVHAPHVLVVLDEAGGIAPAIWDAVDKITTTGHTMILAIGNPDDPNSQFARITRPGSGWHVIRVDGLRTPNMTDELTRPYPLLRALLEHEDIPFSTEEIPEYMRPVMLSPRAVNDRLIRWCGCNPDAPQQMTQGELREYVAKRAAASQLFTASMRGEFPDGGTHSVIPMGWVRRAIERWKDWEEAGRPDPEGRLVCGVDVATSGDDQTAVSVRKGNVVMELHTYGLADTMETADMVVVHMRNVPQAIAVVDIIGVGSGVRDKLRRDGVATYGFNASSQSDRTDKWDEFRFLNDRAAAWWRMRELLDPANGSLICLPDDEEMVKELCAPTWRVRTGKGRGVIQIESKDDIKKRLDHSTDRADAVIESFWIDGAALNAHDPQDGAIPWGGDGRPTASSKSAGIIAYEIGDRPTRPGSEFGMVQW